MPYNITNRHWTLIILDLKECKIYYLNPSEYGSEIDILKTVQVFLTRRDRKQKIEKIHARKWEIQPVSHCPKQSKVIIGIVVFMLYFISNFFLNLETFLIFYIVYLIVLWILPNIDLFCKDTSFFVLMI